MRHWRHRCTYIVCIHVQEKTVLLAPEWIQSGVELETGRSFFRCIQHSRPRSRRFWILNSNYSYLSDVQQANYSLMAEVKMPVVCCRSNKDWQYRTEINQEVKSRSLHERKKERKKDGQRERERERGRKKVRVLLFHTIQSQTKAAQINRYVIRWHHFD